MTVKKSFWPRLAVALILMPALLSSSPIADSRADEPKRYQLSEMKLFNWVILNIKDNYLDQKRVNPREMLSASLNYVERYVAEILVTESADKNSITVQVGDRKQTFAVGDVGTIWEMAFKVKDIFNFVQSSLTSSMDPRDIEYTAINGMLSTLDPHSVFLKPDLYKEIKTTTKGKFGGLGIQIQAKEGFITVVAPLKDTPAWKAGIKRMDKIVRIDDESTANMTIDEAVNRLRGNPGTKVTVWILREGFAEPKKFTLVREEIKIVTIESELLEGGIGYIKLMQFTEQSPQDLMNHYNEMKARNGSELKGLVLDMRDNPGGLLESSIKISNDFLKSGIIVSTVAQEGQKIEERKADSSDYRIGIPVAVLVNGGSASASEIVSGALKDNNRAITIGQTTFGKGSVQVLYERAVPGEGSGREKKDAGLKLTVAQYLTPADISIQSVGIIPDVFLEPMTIRKDSIKLFFHDRPHKEKDLAKHLDDMKAREEKPALKLKYIGDEKDMALFFDEEEESEENNPSKNKPAKEEPDKDKFVEDFSIRYAKKIIVTTKSPTRIGMVEAAKASVESIEKSEETRLISVLAQYQLDWTDGPVPQNPQIKTQIHIETKDGKPAVPQVLRAGEELYLAFTAKNAGTETVYRLTAVLDSKEPLFEGREFHFGKLPAGAEKKDRIKIKTPKDYLSGISEYSLQLFSGRSHLMKPVQASLGIIEQPRPRFAASYKFTDSAPGGNGNGAADIGETLTLSVTLKNIGKGVSDKPKISVKNMSGKDIYIKNGRCDLHALPFGKTDTCSLSIEIRKEMREDRFAVLLSAFDNELGEALGEKLVIPLKGSDLVPPEGPGFNVTSTLAGSFEAPVISVSSVPDSVIINTPSINVEGSVTDSSGFKDFYVKVNDKKIFYKAAGDKTKSMPFKVDVPLKDGINVLYLVARKTDELMAVEKFILTRPVQQENGK
jgi:carboxyl-terminal processing protease